MLLKLHVCIPFDSQERDSTLFTWSSSNYFKVKLVVVPIKKSQIGRFAIFAALISVATLAPGVIDLCRILAQATCIYTHDQLMW